MSKLYLIKSEKDCWKVKLQGCQHGHVWCKYWTEQWEQTSVPVTWIRLSFFLIRTNSEKYQWGIEIGKNCFRKWSGRPNYSCKLGALKWERLNHAGFESAQEKRLENAKNSWKKLRGKSKQGVENRSCYELIKHHEHLSEEGWGGWLRGEKGQAQRWGGTCKVWRGGEEEILCEEMNGWRVHISWTPPPHSSVLPKICILVTLSVLYSDIIYVPIKWLLMLQWVVPIVFPLLAQFDEKTKPQFCCHLIKKGEGTCLVLVTFLYSVDFVL